MPRFHVRDAFTLEDKNLFVLAGFALEGEIAAGMRVSLPFNATVKMTAAIDHLQVLRRPDGDVVCLCIRCADPAEAELWEALQIKDHIIDVIPLA